MYKLVATMFIVLNCLGCAMAKASPAAMEEGQGSSNKASAIAEFIRQEMKKDGVDARILGEYGPRIKEAAKREDIQLVRELTSKAIEEAYGIRLWRKVSFKSSDGLVVPAFLTTAKGREKKPGLVLVHGAKHGSANIYLRHAFLLAKNGYSSLAVDYRSSTGHGDYLESADDPAPGGKEFDDVAAAVTFIKHQEQIDPNRIGLVGGSRGAYIAAFVSTQMPIQATVLYFGGYDAEELARSGGSTNNEWKSKEDSQDLNRPEVKKLLFERSPMNFAENIAGAVLLIHGSQDNVVNWAQSQAFAKKLGLAGKNVELKIYPGAGHGFVFENTRQALDAYQTTLSFLDKYLRTTIR